MIVLMILFGVVKRPRSLNRRHDPATLELLRLRELIDELPGLMQLALVRGENR